MGRYLRQLLEQDAPVGGGTPAGDPELCFDPNTGAQVPCPQAGETQAAAGGADPALGGGPANQDQVMAAAEAKQVKEEDEVEPDKDGACPEGYEKGDDGKCKKVGGTEGDGDQDKAADDKGKDESKKNEDDDTPPWAKDDDDDAGDDDDKDGDDDSDDDDEDDKDDDKEESLLYRSAVADMVKQVQEGGKAREIVRQAFSK